MFRGPPSLLFSKYWGRFPKVQNSRCMKLNIQLQQVLTKYVTPLSMYIHGVNKDKLLLLVEQTWIKIVDWIHVASYKVQG